LIQLETPDTRPVAAGMGPDVERHQQQQQLPRPSPTNTWNDLLHSKGEFVPITPKILGQSAPDMSEHPAKGNPVRDLAHLFSHTA
jgi:hypothetical protein